MRYQYHVTRPMLPPNADSPVMDIQQMEDWLNFMDERGWEFVGYGQTLWTNQSAQQWWIFRKPRTVEFNQEVKEEVDWICRCDINPQCPYHGVEAFREMMRMEDVAEGKMSEGDKKVIEPMLLEGDDDGVDRFFVCDRCHKELTTP